MWDLAPLLSPAATCWLRRSLDACEDPGVLALGQPQGAPHQHLGTVSTFPKLFWLDHHGVFVTLCHPVPHSALAGPESVTDVRPSSRPHPPMGLFAMSILQKVRRRCSLLIRRIPRMQDRECDQDHL